MRNYLVNKIRRYLLRNDCVIGDHSILYGTASISNNLGEKECIRIGNFCHIRGELLLFGHNGRISIGDYCYVGNNSYIWSAKNIAIGDRVLISHNCNIFDNDTHPLEPKARHRQFLEIITKGHPRNIDLQEEEVIIEDDVMISANVSVLKGVHIGKGAVIGAGSVVTRSVPAFALIAGNPARIIRMLQL